MTNKELRKLQRMELLEILVDQRKRIDELEKELAEVRKKAESREIKIRNSGSLAEASLALSRVFEEAQWAADLYLENVRRTAMAKTQKADDYYFDEEDEQLEIRFPNDNE